MEDPTAETMQKTSALPVPLQKSEYQGRELVHIEKSPVIPKAWKEKLLPYPNFHYFAADGDMRQCQINT